MKLPRAPNAPTIDLVVGYSESKQSPILQLFLAHLDELIGRVGKAEI